MSFFSQQMSDEDEDVFYDAFPPDPDEAEGPLYEGARITRSQSSTMIMAFAIRHSLSGAAVQDLLNVMNEHLPSPCVPRSNYLLRKYCMPDTNGDIVYHVYCGNCTSYLGTDEELSCDVCGIEVLKLSEVKKGNFFISLSLSSQLRNLLEQSSVRRRLELNMHHDGSFQDVRDGKLYREAVKPGDISLTFNSDGISPFQSTSGSVWPILCTVNELAPKERQKHVMLAGIWFGCGKPNMQVFLKSFVEECATMADVGLDWQNPDTQQYVNTKVIAISCSCDSVARCQLQGLVQFNGYFGCNWCLHPSERFQGVKHIFPSSDPPHELRTHRSFCQDAIRARQTGQKQNGIKPDPSPLLLLPKFNIVSGFPVDYMHAVCEGVVDRLVSLWFDTCYSQEPWYIGRQMPSIDQRIQGITPPSEITRLPASPRKRAFWKASEFRSWLLFYLLPVLSGILPAVYLKHVALLVRSIWLLNKDRVTTADIEVGRSLLNRFVRGVGRLYGAQHLTFNNHILLHLPDTVSNWGPLWSSSCFLFEGFNRKIKSLFHGTRGVAHQVVNNFVIAQELSNRLNGMGADTPVSIVDTLKTLLRGYPLLPSVTKVEQNNDSFLLKGRGNLFQCDGDVEQCLSILTNHCVIYIL